MAVIEPGVLDEMVERLVEGLGPEQIILFGSRAWDQPDESSDVDLLVVMPDSASAIRPAERARRAYRCLRGIDVPTDLLVKTRAEVERFRHVPGSLEAEILRRGKVLYG
jgi:predicted nucleotidyltransferase